MKTAIFTKTLALLVLSLFIVAADGITRTLPDGTDLSSLQCSTDIVYIGNRSGDVLAKCGKPIKKTQFIDQPGIVWVYQLDQVDRVYYLAFVDGRLQRILDVRCLDDNPDCK